MLLSTLDCSQRARQYSAVPKREAHLIEQNRDGAGHEPAALLSIIFTDGRRPEAENLLAAVDSQERVMISHWPDHVSGIGWGELLIDGLTFDIFGFGAKNLGRISRPRHFAGFSSENPWVEGDADAISIALGPHLAEATPNIPITRAIAELGAALAGALEYVVAVVWHPADLAVDPGTFHASIGAWLGTGYFPAEALVAAKKMPDDGYQSVGLGYFIGQEIRVEPELVLDRGDGPRLVGRLAGHFALGGPVTRPDEVVGPDGTPLRIEPSANGKFIRISRG